MGACELGANEFKSSPIKHTDDLSLVYVPNANAADSIFLHWKWTE